MRIVSALLLMILSLNPMIVPAAAAEFALESAAREQMLADQGSPPAELIRLGQANDADIGEQWLLILVWTGLGAAGGWAVGKAIRVDPAAPEPTQALAGTGIGSLVGLLVGFFLAGMEDF